MRQLVRTRVPTRAQAMLTIALLSLLSTGAMLGLTNRADERWHPYRFGPDALADPLQVITYPVRFSFSSAQNIGNFRPLGRIVEHANYLVDEVLAITTGLPVHVVLGLVRMASAAALGVLLIVLVTRLVDATGTQPAGGTLVPFAVAGAFPGLLVAYGVSSSMVVFSGMYLQTAMLIVAAALLFTSPALYDPQQRTSATRVSGMALFGMAVAVFNELAWLAVPVAGATLLALLLASRRSWRRWWSLPALRHGAAAGGGFLALAVPIRVYLADACADGSCYASSDPSLTGVTPDLYVNRLIAGLPLPSWRSGPFFDRLPVILFVGLVAAAVVLAVLRLTAEPADADAAADTDGGPGEPATNADAVAAGRPWWVPVVVGVVMLLGAAALASVSPYIQEARNPWQGWREAPVLFAGWALVLGGVAGAVADRIRRPWGLVALLVIASLGVGSAVVGTTFQHHRDARDGRLVLTETIGVEIASFERSEAGDARRCALLAEFIRLHPDLESQVQRLRQGVEEVSQDRHGLPFCSEEPPSG